MALVEVQQIVRQELTVQVLEVTEVTVQVEEVECTFAGGRLTAHQMHRPPPPDQSADQEPAAPLPSSP